MSKKIWVTEVPLYRVEVAVSQSTKKLDAFMGEKQNWPEGKGGGFLFDDNDSRVAISIAEQPGAGIIAHECLHAAIHILQGIGNPPIDASNDETTAYLMQWLIEWIYETAELK